MATRLSKKDLRLVGSAGTMDGLKQLIKSRLYWAEVNTEPSTDYESRLGKVHDVSNRNGLIANMVIIEGSRCSLYHIEKAA